MAKVQFNCRLEEATVAKINAEVERLSRLHGFVVSQGDVIELKFVGPIVQSSKKMSKREEKIAAIRALDPSADNRPDVEYGSDELPSGDSMAIPRATIDATGPKASDGRGKVSLPLTSGNWRSGRKPLLKPSAKGK